MHADDYDDTQLAVAKAVLTDLKLPSDATPKQKAEAEKQAQQHRREITDRLIFGRMPAFARVKTRKQPKQEVAVQITALDKSAKSILPSMPAGQVVQLAFL
mgnify:CR=1 FL=1